MIRKRHSQEKIIGMLREAAVVLAQGVTGGQVCRQLSISEQTYYRWRNPYGGLKISQAKRIKDSSGKGGVKVKGQSLTACCLNRYFVCANFGECLLLFE